MNSHALPRMADECGNVPGFWTEMVIPMGAWRTSAMLTLTGGTTPVVEVSSNTPRVTWSTLDTAALQVGGWSLPRHADTAEENKTTNKRGTWFMIDATLNQAGTTDTVTMTCTIYARTPGSTVQKGPFTATATLSANNTYTRKSFEFRCATDASGYQIEPGDSLSVTLAPSTHSNDPIYLNAVSLRYKGLVSFAKDSDKQV